MAEDIDKKNDKMVMRGELGSQVGGQVGAQAGGMAGSAVGAYFGGPIGAAIGEQVGSYLGEQVGKKIGEEVGDKAEDKLKEEAENQQEEEQPKKKSGGGCSGGAGGAGEGEQSTSEGECHKSPKTPKFKKEIQENDIPENWWDKLPDFDPRVYDAITMEQAAACVNYIFEGLPDMHELENSMEARKNRKTCPRLKTQVPRTKVIKPKEVIANTPIDDFIKSDETY